MQRLSVEDFVLHSLPLRLCVSFSCTLCLLNTFNHESKKKEVVFLKVFNAASTNSRTDDGQTDGSTVMTKSSVLIFFLVPILVR